MDTKSKNTKYNLGTKIIAVIIIWVSAAISLASGIFLLDNLNVIATQEYEDTYEYREQINMLVHNTVEMATKSTSGGEEPLGEERYNSIEYNLGQAINFNYYIKDLETNKVSYKIPKDLSLEDIKKDPNSIYLSKDEVPGYLYYSDFKTMLEKSPNEIYILLNDPLVAGDAFYDTYKDFEIVKTYTPYAVAGLIVSMIFLLISLGYLVMVSGRKEKDGEIHLAVIDRIYNDIQSVLVIFAAVISLAFISSISLSRGSYYNFDIVLIAIILAIDAAIGMIYFFSMLRQFKKGVLFKNTLVYKILNKMVTIVRNLFSSRIFKPWMLGLLLIYGVINGWLFILSSNRYGGSIIAIFIIIFNILAIHFASNKLESLSIIMNGAKEISKGDLDYKIDKTQISTEFKDFAGDIESIQGGLKEAVDEAIKGERMKTDLITNVSHDLKTPLTSIINYVDLLKQEKMDNENANEYLDVLDEKSYRLKQLIEDLIEASKASSGNVVVTTDKVDLQELVTQACGEYQDKIQEAQLEVRTNAAEDTTLILADGKLMWRVIENIISNAIKYSMKNSRIYIDINEKHGYGQLIIKNVSAYPLDIDPGELTDRFTRADESRTTEGSGLGLSIAQSLTSIQNGRFNIDIDGDLFKVTIEIPLYK